MISDMIGWLIILYVLSAVVVGIIAFFVRKRAFAVWTLVSLLATPMLGLGILFLLPKKLTYQQN